MKFEPRQPVTNKNMTLFRALPLVALGLLTSPLGSKADFLVHHWENHRMARKALSLIPELSYFTTKTNYDSNSGLSTPSGLNNYSRFHTDATVSYGLTKRFTVYGRVGWVLANIDATTGGGNSFGFSDQSVGVNFHTVQFGPRVSIDLQLQADIPLYSNTDAATNNLPFLGDGSYDITGGAFFSVPLDTGAHKKWLLLSGGGYTWRSSGWSGHIPWMFEGRYQRPHKGIFVRLGFRGIQSLNTDSADESTGCTSAATGGSCAITGINQSMAQVKGTVGYRFSSRLSAHVGGQYVIWGKNAPQGFGITGGMKFRWGENPRKIHPENQTPNSYGRSNRGFINYGVKGTVTRVNDRLNLIKIDRGKQHGVKKGQIFDIFSVDRSGKADEPIARARVTSVKTEEAALTIVEYYREVWIEKGFIAKRPLK